MRQAKLSLLISALILVSSVACTSPSTREGMMDHPIVAPSGVQADRSVLAGEWDYEEAAVVTLLLDEEGNGTYDWKGGRFETQSLSDHTWQGRWIQQENDREGGFIVQLSPDYSNGEGQWWYTRIEDDLAPTQKGGTFTVTKRSPTARAMSAPAFP